MAKEKEVSEYVLSVSTVRPKDDWILDSGCTHHVTPNREFFSTYEPIDGGDVLMGKDAPCKIIGIGSFKIKMYDGVVRTLTEVRHVPELKKNLISLSTLDAKGYRYSGEGGVLKVSKGTLVVLKGQLSHGIYTLMGTTCISEVFAATTPMVEEDITKLWRMRLGHMSQKGLELLSKRGLLCGQSISKVEFCEHCVLGKQKRITFGTVIHRTQGTLDYIHSDVWGPSQVPSKGGANYFVTFIDDFSQKVWVYMLKKKSEVFKVFKQWKALVEN